MDSLMRISALALALALAACAVPKHVVPRQELFSGVEKTRPMLSHDGKWLAYLAVERGPLALVIRDLSRGGERVVDLPAADVRRGIASFFWHPDNRHILYWHDNQGDENYHLYQLDPKSGKVTDLIPFQGSRTELLALESGRPREILVTSNARDKATFDVYRVDFAKHKATREVENPGNAVGWIVDGQLRVRGAVVARGGDAKAIYLRGKGKKAGFKPLGFLPADLVITSVLGYSKTVDRIWVLGHQQSDTAQLFEVDVKARTSRVLYGDPKYDTSATYLSDSKRKTLEAVFIERDKPRWVVLGSRYREPFAQLRRKLGSEFKIVSRDDRDRTWVIQPESDVRAPEYHLYDLKRDRLTPLFRETESLSRRELRPMQPIFFNARDGLELDGYLTLPGPEYGGGPHSMVLQVHGGPWTRTSWGYDPETQWLASRGYAVLNVNFRGSAGYGTRFFRQGRREWGGKMLTDLIDAKNWAISKGYTISGRVCISGASYGGYAVLSALTTYPEDFACGVASASISDLATFVRELPPYWRDVRGLFHEFVGNPDDPRDMDLMRTRSPLNHAARLKSPLLLIHGSNDVRTRRNQGDLMAAELKRLGKPVDYLVIPDTGHSWAPKINYRVEEFLGRHLGGYVESPSGVELRSDDSQ